MQVQNNIEKQSRIEMRLCCVQFEHLALLKKNIKKSQVKQYLLTGVNGTGGGREIVF